MSELVEMFLSAIDVVPGFRVVLAAVLVFFAPGLAWSLVLFRGRQLHVIERLALSFGLSLAGVVLSMLALNIVFGVRINGFNTVVVIAVLTAIPLLYYGLRRFSTGRGDAEGGE